MSAELREAAVSLHASLRRFPWLITVGVGLVGGSEGLVVYSTQDSKQIKEIVPSRWEGFAVCLLKMSRPIPLRVPFR